VAVTRESDAEVIEGESGEGEGGKITEMGRKPLIPYGLYKGYGFFSPSLATQTGVTSKDLELFWEALQNMWELDRSASRGMMALRGLYIFTHDSKLGNAHAHELFERIEPRLRNGIKAPRSFKDYKVSVEENDLPEGIKFARVVG
jgi:CRISPR-associated protein Csd2